MHKRMGNVHHFRRPPRNRGRKQPRKPPPRRFGWGSLRLVALGIGFTGLAGVTGWQAMSRTDADGTFQCEGVRVIDGDTFDCGGRRIRLQGIDAPEMAGHCRPGRECAPGDPIASTENLSRLVAWSAVQCRPVDVDAYGRTVARCTTGEKDLSCAQLDAGQAIRRYAEISC